MTKFEAWLKGAKPGENFVYAEGPFLFENSQVYAVRRAYDAGLIELVQKRTVEPKSKASLGPDGCGRFEYLAIKRAIIAKRRPSEWRTEPQRRAA